MGDLSFVALLGVIFLKEAGLPLPVPGDLLVLGAGVAAVGQGPAAGAELAAILVAGYAGGSVQFALVRGRLRRAAVRLLERLGVSGDRLDALAVRLRLGGARGVAVARATPGVRVGAIAASALAALPFGVFARGLVGGNTLFVGGHFVLGYAIGAPVVGVISGVGALVVGIVALALVGAAGWWLIRRRRASRASAAALQGDGAAPRDSGVAIGRGSIAGAWVEAACPVCLILAAVSSPSGTMDGGAHSSPTGDIR
jgi:membrane-associated protein